MEVVNQVSDYEEEGKGEEDEVYKEAWADV
jgi:hypothetical protein